MKTYFEDLELTVLENIEFEFLMENLDVAQGYGVSIQALSNTKSRHSDELIENKHFLFMESDTNGGKQRKLFWTKRGVIRLGFFIKSERAKKFRDWAEDLVINKLSQTPEKSHQTVQVQNDGFDIKLYTQQSREIFELVQLINSQNSKTLYFADNLYKNLNIQSPLELLKINLENYYFIPTELGKFINASPVETNKILEFKGFQTKWNLGFN